MNTPGHTPDAERFTWIYDGILDSGTLQEYADIWERNHYDADHGLSSHVIRWNGDTDPVKIPVTVENLGTDDNDYMKYRFTVPVAGQLEGTAAYAFVDGRA